MQIDKHVENIASHIELQEELMHDDPLSEMRRIEALRDMPECLTVKRSIKAKLSQSINFKSRKKVLSRWKKFKYTFSIFFIKVIKLFFIYFLKTNCIIFCLLLIR